MLHAFPRTFSLPVGTADRVGAASECAPLTPAAYLRLCREAAGMTRGTVAVMLAPRPGDLAQTTELIDMLETPGNVARRAETLQRLSATFTFDPDVYRQLASEPPERHPRVCRGCAASAWSEQDDRGPLCWANDHVCTRCAGVDGHGDAQ